MVVPRRLKGAREARGWSQEQLARLTGVTRTYINMIESGARPTPSLRVLRLLAKALRVPVGHLADVEWKVAREFGDGVQIDRVTKYTCPACKGEVVILGLSAQGNPPVEMTPAKEARVIEAAKQEHDCRRRPGSAVDSVSRSR